MTHLQANPANQTNFKKLDKFLGIVLIASTLVITLYFTTKANLDLTQGRYALFMDERITFDGVKKLLHPESFLAFIDTVIDGKDHRYGRILWNVSALFSFLPEKIGGVSGQIIATRFTQAIIQLLAYSLLVFTFIQSWTLRGLAFLLLIVLPYTAYFATMPKPEPIQLFSLALFLAFSIRNQFRFGYYWVFLGLAFGAKVSTLTLLPLFIGLGLLGQLSQIDWVEFPIEENQTLSLKKLFHLGLITLGIYQILYGLTLLIQGKSAEPIKLVLKKIVPPIPLPFFVFGYALIPIGLGLIFILTPVIAKYLEGQSFIRIHGWLKVFGSFILGFCIAVPIVFFKFPLGLVIWLRSTLLSTSHGSDDTSITVYSWVRYTFSDYLSLPPFLLVPLFLAICIIFTLVLVRLIKKSKAVKTVQAGFENLISESHPFILLLISLFSVVPIFLTVDRLWGHYLHLGTVFFVVATFLCCEKLLTPNPQTSLPPRWVVALIVSVLTVQTLITFFYMMPAMATEMSAYAQRTATPEFQQQKAEHDYLVNLFQSKVSSQAKPLNIHVALSLFIPDSTEDWQITEFAGYFQGWQTEPDLVVMYREGSPLSHQPLNTSARYEPWLAAKTAMLEHISSADQTCSVKPCYLELSSPHPELLILAKQP